MLKIYRDRIESAVKEIRDEAERRRSSTPSDVSIEAFVFAAKCVEQAIVDAERASERLTPAQYGQVHNVTQQTVTRWIRLGELQAELTAGGYLIAHDAVRVPRIPNHGETLGRTG